MDNPVGKGGDREASSSKAAVSEVLLRQTPWHHQPPLTFECPWHSFLSTGDVHAGGGDGIIAAAFQRLALMDLFEECVGSILKHNAKKDEHTALK